MAVAYGSAAYGGDSSAFQPRTSTWDDERTSSSGWPGYILNGSGVARPMRPSLAERDELARLFRVRVEIDRMRKRRQTDDELILVDLL